MKVEELQAIVSSSKLYKSSKRKSQILSGLVDPNNAGLVAQLANQLDKPFRKSKYLDKSADDADLDSDDGLKNGEKREGTRAPSGGRPSGPGRSFAKHADIGDLSGKLEDAEEGDAPSDAEIDAPDADEEISEAKDIPGIEVITDVSPEDVKRILSSDEEISDVSRVEFTDDKDELWIHYNDKINLNTVMEKVISSLRDDCPGYNFNRLARTENAIVFCKE